MKGGLETAFYELIDGSDKKFGRALERLVDAMYDRLMSKREEEAVDRLLLVLRHGTRKQKKSIVELVSADHAIVDRKLKAERAESDRRAAELRAKNAQPEKENKKKKAGPR